MAIRTYFYTACYHLHMRRNNVLEKKIWFATFIIYVAIVLKLTIFRDSTYTDRQLNLILFTNLLNVYTNYGVWQFLRLFLGNIGWFLPFGFLLPMLLDKNNIIKITMLGFCFSLIIEVSQFIFRKGVAEVDDLILNTLGVIIGYLAYSL